MSLFQVGDKLLGRVLSLLTTQELRDNEFLSIWWNRCTSRIIKNRYRREFCFKSISGGGDLLRFTFTFLSPIAIAKTAVVDKRFGKTVANIFNNGNEWKDWIKSSTSFEKALNLPDQHRWYHYRIFLRKNYGEALNHRPEHVIGFNYGVVIHRDSDLKTVDWLNSFLAHKLQSAFGITDPITCLYFKPPDRLDCSICGGDYYMEAVEQPAFARCNACGYRLCSSCLQISHGCHCENAVGYSTESMHHRQIWQSNRYFLPLLRIGLGAVKYFLEAALDFKLPTNEQLRSIGLRD